MLNALHRFLLIPLKFYILKQHSDIHWECEANLAVLGHKKVIKVFMQDEEPAEIAAWEGPKIVVDLRHPDLWESAKRTAGGFKRVPSILNFGD
jgi:hypothetical protein